MYFEKDLSLLATGQHVKAYTNNDPGKQYDAEILLIGKNLDADRVAEVHCHFERYEPALVPGMFMNGEITVTGRKALTVPESAVVRWENKHYIFEEKSTGTFNMVQVQPGVSQPGQTNPAGGAGEYANARGDQQCLRSFNEDQEYRSRRLTRTWSLSQKITIYHPRPEEVRTQRLSAWL